MISRLAPAGRLDVLRGLESSPFEIVLHYTQSSATYCSSLDAGCDSTKGITEFQSLNHRVSVISQESQAVSHWRIALHFSSFTLRKEQDVSHKASSRIGLCLSHSPVTNVTPSNEEVTELKQGIWQAFLRCGHSSLVGGWPRVSGDSAMRPSG
ncbi:hypothetical protein R1flu_020707 [Riccia fluitans]|uniref:Uncharacterized protein n=1 Tax=Riccia fluitans TaxID=41844 RepID=A0ABD1ZQZ3_9MARC